MVQLAVSSSLLSRDVDQTLLDAVAQIENYADPFEFGDALSDLDFGALLTGQPVLTSDTAIWSSHPQIAGEDVVLTLSGPNFPSQATIEAALSVNVALYDAVTNLDLNRASVMVGSDEVLVMDLSSTGVSFTSGSVTLNLEMPVQSGIDLEGLLSDLTALGTAGDLAQADLDDLVGRLNALGVTSFNIDDGDQMAVDISFGGAALATLSVGDFGISMVGSGEGFGLGSLVQALSLLDEDNGVDVAGLEGLGVEDVSGFGPDGQLLFNYDLDGPDQTLITPAEGATDFPRVRLGFGDDYSNLPLSIYDLDDLSADGQPLIVDLTSGADYEGVSVQFSAVADMVGSDRGFSSLTIQGGDVGTDGLHIATYLLEYQAGRFTSELVDYNAFYAARNAYNEAQFSRNPIDQDAFDQAYSDWSATFEGDAPNQEDFIDPTVVNVPLLEADRAAFDEAHIARFGPILSEYPNEYSDTYYIAQTPGLPDDRWNYAAFDYDSYWQAQNDYYALGDSSGDEPQLIDFAINPGYFDHASLLADREKYNVYTSNVPNVYDDKYRLPIGESPLELDYANLDDPLFDGDRFLAAWDAVLEDWPDARDILNEGFPQDRDFRTSWFNIDYQGENGQSKEAFDWEAFSEASDAHWALPFDERETTPQPLLEDFIINEDLYDHAELIAAREAYRELQQAIPLTMDYAISPAVVVDMQYGSASASFGEFVLGEFSFSDMEYLSYSPDVEFTFLGTEGNDRIAVWGPLGIVPGIQEMTVFDAGGGDADVFDLRDADNGDWQFRERLTVQTFIENVRAEYDTSGGVRLRAENSGHTIAELTGVEFIRLYTDDTLDDWRDVPIDELVQATEQATELADEITGTQSADDLDGLGGNDTIFGLDGDDTLTGGGGDDLLEGGAGNDRYIGGIGNDTISDNEADIENKLDYRDSPDAIVADLAAGTVADGYGTTDTIDSTARLYIKGSAFDDEMRGDDGNNGFSGEAGDDTLDGRGGQDYVWYGTATSALEVDLAAGTATGGGGSDTLTSIEVVLGSNYSDLLQGSDADEWFRPDQEHDIWTPDYDIGGEDTVDGRGGSDGISYHRSVSGVTVDLAEGYAIDGNGNRDTLRNIENATGSEFDDVIRTGATSVEVSGRGGDDLFVLGDGHIQADGGADQDWAVIGDMGGDQVDVLVRDDEGIEIGSRATPAEGAPAVASPLEGAIASAETSNVEGVIWNAPDAVFNYRGSRQDNLVSLWSIAALIDIDTGEGSFDRLMVDQLVREGDASFGMTQAEFARAYSLQLNDDGSYGLTNRSTGVDGGRLENVEIVRFAEDDNEDGDNGFAEVNFADLRLTRTLSAADDPGRNADDDESFFAGNDPTPVEFDGGGGNDNFGGGAGEDTAEGGTGDDALDGGGGNDTLGGGVGDDSVNGGTGDDSLDGGDGFDTLTGGEGDDELTDAIGVNADGGEGNDQAITQAGNNILEDSGPVAGFTVNSVEINDFYCGGWGNDRISTGAGNDIAIGDAESLYYFGNDTIDGGVGMDLLQGGGDADVFIFEAGDTTADGDANGTIMGDDVIGSFSINAIFDELGGGLDITTFHDEDSDAGRDFEIGLDIVQLQGFSAQTEADMAVDLGAFLEDDAGGLGVRFEAEGVRILFADIAEAELTAVAVSDVFEFV